MRHLQDQTVLILGLGASGLAMARWWVRHGASVTVADTREAPALLATLRQELPAVKFVSGAFTPDLVQGSAVRAVYRSPGLAPAVIAPVVDAARAMGLPVGGELDLFSRALADLREVSATEVVKDHLVPPESPLSDASDISDASDATDAVDSLEGEAALAADASGDIEEMSASDVVEGAPVSEDAGEDAALPALLAPAPAEQAAGYRPVVLAITGTNGKTTVTSLVGQLVQRAGKTVAVAGNIGPTLLDTLSAHLDADTLPQVWVLELSSFQLADAQDFEPTAAVVLNVTQDHLDWHGDMDAYVAAKARIFGRSTFMLLNRDDPRVMEMLPTPVKVRLRPPQVRPHSTFGAGEPQRPGDYGIETVNGMAWLVRAAQADETIKRRKGEEVELHIQRLMPLDALRIRGRHNATNALAALGLAVAAGCSLAPMLHGLREYRGEPHRVESIAVVNDVEYFDDSKGTNVGATAAALAGLGAERKLVVILGGEGKGQDFSPLAEPVSHHARAVVLIGKDAPLIRSALQASQVALLDAASMQEAVSLAAAQAHTGDAVLMSPACASFDMFDNYEHRAQVFCDAVQALAQEQGVVL
ncbi:UDP-N-acetylmuramoyl-L-alanine--D-glutamate ligase [Polaromonas sp. JS666]|uniref:UDP-N-acetylmuramoylalanine--D-glutamate ligase n=1 Tax=Polaromonas sp. (strain JS666 / ATCC BAA-500) TaxID=296591 RepID=MURD_POLSJ|nr:UDP-N-acetylmuramoyl-L-alanine--D-glutamate ligase [Polaromonas sp. JS666]Q12EL7.1 RecName: Full=UDP-N-acetylmuramoylalanine--D-glutamate ligase; AltName: Full=D-glutamic acid-adding enzyme; AltName: Full=UDP-N-acetylmuramoyl-L-alanyl-D-glutamate synthetase [Polaromonas sp. JS666]ABE43025.1 UDP-N-acetylmuramoylalanine--D-glutamate ligase [Polaromonas sp. JS666]